MAPTGVLLDFEEALSKGFTNIFPDALAFGDFFHVVQANVKQAGQLGLKPIVIGLRKLWHAPSKEKFDNGIVVLLTTPSTFAGIG